jgi:hypothetical protein
MSQKREPNYKRLMYISMVFIALGIVLFNYFDVNKSIGIVFIAVGGLFLMISLRNKSTWADNNR